MRESAKGLRPDDTKVAEALIVDFGEAAVEDVGEGCHTEAGNDGFAAFIAGGGVSLGI